MNAVTVTFTLRPKTHGAVTSLWSLSSSTAIHSKLSGSLMIFLTPRRMSRERRNVTALLALSLSLGVGAAHFI
jgi:hypothetical protein